LFLDSQVQEEEGDKEHSTLLPLHIQKSHALEETYKVIPHNFFFILGFRSSGVWGFRSTSELSEQAP
jgi:hypothetical protein